MSIEIDRVPGDLTIPHPLSLRPRWRASLPCRAMRFSPLVILALSLAGCGASASKVSQENDRLRERILQLEQEVKGVKARNAELETRLAQADRTPTTIPDEVAASTPHVAAIALSRLSHARDDNHDGRPDTLLLYLEPSDGLGRFLQLVGTITVHAAILPDQDPAQTIGQRAIGPKELRECYRSAFTGQYYALTLPIDPPADATSSIVRITFTDAYSGRSFSTERSISLK